MNSVWLKAFHDDRDDQKEETKSHQTPLFSEKKTIKNLKKIANKFIYHWNKQTD